MKQAIIYLALLCSITTAHHSYTMHNFANGFRKAMKTAHLAGLVGLPAYAIAQQVQYLKDEPGAEVFSENSKQFILATMQEAYPELKDRELVILGKQGDGWFSAQWGNKNYLLTPCDEKELQKAIAYKKNNTRNPLLAMMEETNKLEAPCRVAPKDYNFAVYIAMEEDFGIAMTPSTIDIWKGTLLHEASHLLHNDSTKNLIEQFTFPMLVHFGMQVIKKKLGLTTLLHAKPILGNVLKGCGYIPSLPLKLLLAHALTIPLRYAREYRADQEAIERAHDPAILEASSISFQHYPEARTIKDKVGTFLGAHPSNKKRAAYYKEGALKLEEKLTQSAEKKD